MSARPFPLPLRPVSHSGRDKAAEPTDPYQAMAVAVPTPGHDGMAAMGRVFVEEFAMLGWPRERIARMFRIPRYVGPHAVYRTRGPAFVDELLDQVLGPSENPTGSGLAAGWAWDPAGTAMSRQAKSQEEAPPVGGDAAGWAWDPAGTAMSRQAKSQED